MVRRPARAAESAEASACGLLSVSSRSHQLTTLSRSSRSMSELVPGASPPLLESRFSLPPPTTLASSLRVHLHARVCPCARLRVLRNARAGGRQNMKVKVKLGVPPEAGGVDLEAVRAVFPYGKLLPIEIVAGGLTFQSGRVVKELGDEGDMVRSAPSYHSRATRRCSAEILRTGPVCGARAPRHCPPHHRWTSCR